MSADLDRFDRMLLSMPAISGCPAAAAHVGLTIVRPPVVPERQPVIHSKRPARYVAHATCPMCGVEEVGVEYHGTLMSGAKVHQLAAHAPERRRTERGMPRCLGAGMRIELEKGAPTP